MQIEDLYKVYLQHPVVTTDSRDCPQGSIFFALRGESFDGNRFAQSALDHGCAYAVVDAPEFAQDERCILVDNVEQTLQDLAAWHRRQLSIPVIQITGTNGKTTTKELLSSVLARKYNVLYTQGNLNNHLGVPRTLLRITPEYEIAVVETGANHPGEIAFLCRMVQADCGLITNVGRAHLEGFGSFEGVKRTKGELYDDLRSRQGYIFLNGYDDDLRQMAQQRDFYCQDPNSTIPYVEGRVVECNPFLCMQWREHDEAPWHTVRTHLIGAYNVDNLRAAATVGLRFGVSPEDIDSALEDYVPSNSRSEFRDTGRNHLIVDAYNANPSSMKAALTNFSYIQAEHKMVILGEMRELGADSRTEHQRVMEMSQQCGAQEVWLVGENFAQLCTADNSSSMRVFPSVQEVKLALQEHPLQGRTILIKGSNGTRLYQLPEML